MFLSVEAMAEIELSIITIRIITCTWHYFYTSVVETVEVSIDEGALEALVISGIIDLYLVSKPVKRWHEGEGSSETLQGLNHRTFAGEGNVCSLIKEIV